MNKINRWIAFVLGCAVFLTLGTPAAEAGKRKRKKVVLPKVSKIDGDRVITLLPPDRIASVDEPEFVTADEAKFMRDDELVIGLLHNGIVKAYSVYHLDRHEIVNDIVVGDPLAVTW